MKPSRSDSTGILIVRVWNDSNDLAAFRARVTHTLDSMNPEQALATTADPEEVYALVREWVEAFVAPIDPVTAG